MINMAMSNKDVAEIMKREIQRFQLRLCILIACRCKARINEDRVLSSRHRMRGPDQQRGTAMFDRWVTLVGRIKRKCALLQYQIVILLALGENRRRLTMFFKCSGH